MWASVEGPIAIAKAPRSLALRRLPVQILDDMASDRMMLRLEAVHEIRFDRWHAVVACVSQGMRQIRARDLGLSGGQLCGQDTIGRISRTGRCSRRCA